MKLGFPRVRAAGSIPALRGSRPMTSSEQPREVSMSFPDDGSRGLVVIEQFVVTPMGPNLYRMEQSSPFGEVRYHDVVETEPKADGTLGFLRVLTPSGLKTESWVLSRTQIESPALSPLLDKVMAVGGHWERIYGGILLLHLPPAEHQPIADEFNGLFNRLEGSTPDC